jgi:serine O-acetyltransferase
MENYLKEDKQRYLNHMPTFQMYFRKAQQTKFIPLRLLYKALFILFRRKRFIEMSIENHIGGGLYFGHAYCITINPNVIIGKNCNIHRGVLIGQENRGTRQGTPIIGNHVWIGINAIIVGRIKIGNDVLIAPNSYVNCDVPDHSIVIGNPCKIISKTNATREYINREVEEIY